MENSKIEWTDHTFNPWWGCLKVGTECENCYSETVTIRWGFDVYGPAKTTERRLLSDNTWKGPLKWDSDASREGVRKKVFCLSMGDVFEEHPQLTEPRARLWNLPKRRDIRVNYTHKHFNSN